MKVHLDDRAPGRKDELVVLEIEFTTKARRVRVEASDGLEALDLRGERAGGTYDAGPTLPRLHVPLRVTRDGSGTAHVRVVVEDAAAGLAPETWEGQVVLEVPRAAAGAGRAWLWFAAFAAMVGALVYFVGLPLFQPPEVPLLIGKSRGDAERALKSLGFAPVTETVEARTDRDVEVVIGQSPDAAVRAAKGSPVVITVGRSKSAPAGLGVATGVVVPDLVGHTLSEAESSLGGSGLLLHPLSEEAADDQVGRVLRQRPEPGARSLPGSPVEIVVGKKRPVVERDVPDLSGLTRADAEKALTDAQWTVVVTEEEAEQALDGRVLRQSPVAGARAPIGSAVSMVVGREKAPVAIADLPHVLGRPRAEAEKALTDAGFVVEVTFIETADAPPGTVLSQDPLPGAARRGDHVTLRVVQEVPAAPAPVEPTPTPTPSAPTPPPVEAGPAPIAPTPTPVEPVPPAPVPVEPPPAPPVAPAPAIVPDLIGMARDKAEFELRKAGLEARIGFEDVPEDAPEGFVLRQNPSADERATGTTVELTVARHAAKAPAPGTGAPDAGAADVAVPDVASKSVTDASAALSAVGLTAAVLYETVKDANRTGYVLRQEPAAGARLKSGEPVRLVVGRFVPETAPWTPPAPSLPIPTPPAPQVPAGPVVPAAPPSPAPSPAPTPTPSAPVARDRVVQVPVLEGREAAQALEAALAAGLVPSVVPDPAAPAGRVRTQNPAAGSSARIGSTVSLTIGAGSTTAVVDVPSVIGLASKDAVARLVAAGFVTELVRAPVPEGAFAGTDVVVAQSPVGRFGRDQAGVVRVYVPTR